MASIDIRRVYRGWEEEAVGIVIVIDVVRAFSVAAYAFAGGASTIQLVRSVEDARTLQGHNPTALLIGEIDGRLIPGFDLNNSPYLMTRADVRGKHLIQRTGAGTQGAVNARNAVHLLVASLTNAQATARYVAHLQQTTGLPVTFVPTEASTTNVERLEDGDCADYIEALLTRPATAPEVLSERITRLRASDRFKNWRQDESEDFPREDMELVLDANRFPFVMLGTLASLPAEHSAATPVQYVEVRAVYPVSGTF